MIILSELELLELPDLHLEFLSLDFEAVMLELEPFQKLELPESEPFDFDNYT